MSASRRYKVRPCRIKTQDFAGFCEGVSSMLADFYSIADRSTTVRGIQIQFLGGYWARCQLRAGIRYVPTLSILIELQASDLQNSMADSSTAVRGIPLRFPGEYWAQRQLQAGIKYDPGVTMWSEEGTRRGVAGTQSPVYI